jgi:LuxR family transcriptional regulator, maltose regulon positive regulatory protein
VNSHVPIISTKLQPPSLARSPLQREPLAALVCQAAERRLTLVCAPAGYGKTTLIASSLTHTKLPIVWYSLSRSDRDIVTFLAYLAQAFERHWPGFADAVHTCMAPDGAAQPRATAFVAACVNELTARTAEPFLLILDDFQLVDHISEICQVLDLLIRHAPPQAHFVVAARSAPAISSLPRLRAAGEVLEISEAELRFAPEEASALLSHCLRLELPQPQSSALVEQTEGWALALLMAGQSIKGRGPQDATSHLPDRTVDRRVLFEYLSHEVMRQQSPALVNFLLDSAILSGLDPAECDAALGRSDSAAHLERLEKHCLFVTRTADGRLRYHRLFRQFLLQQLGAEPQRLQALHQRAAAFFEFQQDFEVAIFHWLEAGDDRQAARLIASTSASMLRAGRFDTLKFWFSRLPDAQFAEFPELWLQRGQMCEARSQWDQALQYYDRAANAYRALGDLPGLSDALRRKGHILDWRKGKYSDAEKLHREALSYVGEQHRRQRAALLASLARNQLSAGNITATRTLFREALAIYEGEGDRLGQLETLLNPGAWLFNSTGEFSLALALLRRAERLALELNSSAHLAAACNSFALNLYFLGRYAESLAYAKRALELSRACGDAHHESFALMNQANALEATCGASSSALYEQYQRALHTQQGLDNRRFVIATLVFIIVLARRGGNAFEAAQRGQQALALAHECGLRWLTGFVLVQLGAAQVWVDTGAAQASLAEALQIFEEREDRYHLTVTHFWLAALYQSVNNLAYREHLAECLRLAVSHCYDGFFQSEAQAAIPLLVAALEHDLWPGYATQLLAKFGSRSTASLHPLLSHPDAGVRYRVSAAIEALGPQAAPAASQPAEVPTKPASARAIAVPLLTIRAFGSFSVWRGSDLIEEREWGRRKCKRLMKYLALSPGHTQPKDALMDVLWPEADLKAANANFYRTLYNLRRALEPLSPHSAADYVLLEGGLLRLAPEAIHTVDVDQFVEQLDAGRRLAHIGDEAAAQTCLLAGVRLYTGDLSTDDLYDDWIRPRRLQLRELYLGALRELGRLALKAGQLEAAIGHLQQAFGADYTSEDLCCELMIALAQAGRRAEALKYFSTCQAALVDLDLCPSDELLRVKRDLLGTVAPLKASAPLPMQPPTA